MAITPERALSVNFTVPYDTAYIDATLNKAKAGDIKSLEELNNPESVIAVRTGTTAAQAAQTLLPKATIRMFNDEAPAVEEVLSGRAHAFFSSAPLPAMETLKHPTDWYRTSNLKPSANRWLLPCARATWTRSTCLTAGSAWLRRKLAAEPT